MDVDAQLRELSDALEEIDRDISEIRESLEVSDPYRDGIRLGDDEITDGSVSNQSGVKLMAKEDIPSPECRLSANVGSGADGVTTAYLKDESGVLIERRSITHVRPGEWFRFDRSLAAGETYQIVLDARGRDYTRGKSEEEYPLESETIEATSGIYTAGGTETSNYRYNIDRLRSGNRDREGDPLDEVPESAEAIDIVANSDIDEEGDLGEELEEFLDSRSTNHAFIIPRGTYRWDTELCIDQAEFIGILGDGVPRIEIREFIRQPIRFGVASGSDVREATLKDLTFDIDARDGDGNEIDAGLFRVQLKERGEIENVWLRGTRQRWHRDPGGGYNGYRVENDAYTTEVAAASEEAEVVVHDCHLPDGGIHKPESEHHNPGEGIAFSADPPHEGTTYWEGCSASRHLGNTFYLMNSPGRNLAIDCEIYNGSRSALRLGENDEAHDCRIVFDDMDPERPPGSGLWFNGGTPFATDITIISDEGNQHLTRFNSGADGGVVDGLEIVCGAGNFHHCIRATTNEEGNTDGVTVRNFVIRDGSSGGAASSVSVRRPDITLKNGEMHCSSREPITGSHEPTLENVNIE